jgi:hypothetical protein
MAHKVLAEEGVWAARLKEHSRSHREPPIISTSVVKMDTVAVAEVLRMLRITVR